MKQFGTRFVSLILVLFLIISVQPSSAEIIDKELEQAIELGIRNEISDDPVTFAELYTMLDRVVERCAPEKLEAWQQVCPLGRESQNVPDRFNGMCAIMLAAYTMGESYLRFTTDWYSLHARIGEPWDDCAPDPVYADYWDMIFSFSDGDRDFAAAAYFFAMGRTSLMSGALLFDYDPGSNSMRLRDPLTIREAMLAAVRLCDCEPGPFPVIPRGESEADQKILRAAEERKQQILNSETDINVTGRSYYVSSEGDDKNDGLSPETPWATLERVRKAKENKKLKPGDAVLFRRGDLWRGTLYCADGVTYSAYGAGEKPRIYGSPENGTGEEKWILEYEEGEKKIWRFYKEITDCGNIVLNDGETCAFRVFSYWNGKKAVCMDNMEEEFNITQKLNDMQFYSTFSTKNVPKRNNAGGVSIYKMNTSGPLYLRCDAGNPGKLYRSIEFQASTDPKEGYMGIVECTKDNVIDNLCIYYRNTIGINRGTKGSNITVQNCEIGWIGGSTHALHYGDDELYIPVAGECVRLEGNNNAIRNCYVHDAFDGGITFEFDFSNGEKPYFGMTAEDNLIERCISGILVGDHNLDWENTRKNYGDMTLSGNMIMNSGYGWSSSESYDFTWNSKDYNGNAITFWVGPSYNTGIDIRNNTLYSARFALVYTGMDKADMPEFSGNTYAQNHNGVLLFMNPQDNVHNQAPVYSFMDDAVREQILDRLNDQEAIVP